LGQQKKSRKQKNKKSNFVIKFSTSIIFSSEVSRLIDEQAITEKSEKESFKSF